MASELSKFTTNYPLDIKSAKSYFSPIQEGSGDPSPTNIRPIQQHPMVSIHRSQKNMVHIVGYSATTGNEPWSGRQLTNTYGTTISTIDYTYPNGEVVITQSQATEPTNPRHFRNGYFSVWFDNLIFDKHYNVSFRVTNITNNIIDADLSNIAISNPFGNYIYATDVDGDRVIFKNAWYRQSTGSPNRQNFDIYNCGMSFTMSEFMVTPVSDDDITFEPYNGRTYDLNFPTYGKNLLNINVPLMRPNNADGTNTSKRIFTPNTFCPGVSYSNYFNLSAINSYSIEYNKVTINSKSGYGIGFTVSVEPSTTYYLSASYDSNGMVNAALYETDGTFVQLNNGGAVTSFTTTANTNIAVIILRSYNSNIDATFTNIQLEKSSSATTYEPYDSMYQGYVDLITGDLVATHKLVHVDKNMTDTWAKSTHPNADLVRWSVLIPSSDKSYYPNVLCDKFTPCNNYAPDLYGTSVNENGRCIITVPATISTKTLLFDFLDEIGGFDLLYPISPYIHTTIPNQQIKAYIGKNIMWSDYEIDVACNVPYNPMMARRHQVLGQQHLQTITWNNMAEGNMTSSFWKDRDSSETSTTFDNGIATTNFLVSQGSYHTVIMKTSPTVYLSHVYYGRYQCKLNQSGMKLGIEFAGGRQKIDDAIIDSNTWVDVAFIAQGNRDGLGNIYLPFISLISGHEGVIAQTKNPLYIDLTLMFGAGNEPGSVKAFETMCTNNGINFNNPYPVDVGTQQQWII